jgi:hypothetical protein
VRGALRGQVVAKDSGFRFQLTKSELDHIADGDDAEHGSVFLDDEVTHAFVSHSPHHHFDAVLRIAKRGRSHGVSDQHVANRAKVAVDRFHNVSFTDEPNDSAVRRHNGHSANVVIEQKADGRRNFIVRRHGDDPLTIDQISNVHFEPPDNSKGYS